jgi:hypothetical protein
MVLSSFIAIKKQKRGSILATGEEPAFKIWGANFLFFIFFKKKLGIKFNFFKESLRAFAAAGWGRGGKPSIALSYLVSTWYIRENSNVI